MTCDLQAIRERLEDGPKRGAEGTYWRAATSLLAEVDRLMALVEVERERREATQRNFGNMTESARAWQSEAVRLRAAIEQHRRSVNAGIWPPDAADGLLWSVLGGF